MALRPLRGAGLRRPDLRRALPLAVYAAAAVAATADALGSFGSAFIAGGADGDGEAAAGDHLQTVYRFWLFGHQLAHGDAPWRDPYSFQPVVEPQLVLAGWPYGLPFWPLEAAFGPVVAWNTLLPAGIVAAGLATYGWLRLLRLPPGAALLGGLAFAIAPYRLAQSAGHLLGWIAVLLPVALYCLERSWAAGTRRGAHLWALGAFAAAVSIPLSGQTHLAIGALPFLLAYAVLRRRRPLLLWMVGAAAATVGIGLALRYTVIEGSAVASGRTIAQIEMFQADWVDLVSRSRRDGLEQFVYVGWLTPLAALAGLVAIARRRPWLAVLLGLAAVVPLVLAVGTNTPIYEPVWRHFPPLHFPRVPGRIVPLADLALAGLLAFAVAFGLSRLRQVHHAVAVSIAGALVAADLLVLPFAATAADPGNAAYRAAGPGRVLELPLFEPGIHFGSIYDYYAIESPRERLSGYSTLAPPAAYGFFWRHNRLNCGVIREEDVEDLRELGVESLLYHRGAYGQSHREGSWFLWHALQAAGYRSAATGGAVWLFPFEARPDIALQPAPVPEPPRGSPVFCEGWRGFTMRERDAPLWIYGALGLELELSAPGRTLAWVEVDGGEPHRLTVDGRLVVQLTLEASRWHSIVLSVPRLFLDAAPAQGLTIERLSVVSPDLREIPP